MGASTKVQLGARVSPELREQCVAAAKAAGVSLNVWTEEALRDRLRRSAGARSARSVRPVLTDDREPLPRQPMAGRVADSSSAKRGVRPIPRKDR